MAVYGLGLLDGALWGARDDGWVRFSLPELAAERFRLRGAGISNYVEAVGWFGGALYVATNEQVVIPELGVASDTRGRGDERGGR